MQVENAYYFWYIKAIYYEMRTPFKFHSSTNTFILEIYINIYMTSESQAGRLYACCI